MASRYVPPLSVPPLNPCQQTRQQVTLYTSTEEVCGRPCTAPPKMDAPLGVRERLYRVPQHETSETSLGDPLEVSCRPLLSRSPVDVGRTQVGRTATLYTCSCSGSVRQPFAFQTLVRALTAERALGGHSTGAGRSVYCEPSASSSRAPPERNT